MNAEQTSAGQIVELDKDAFVEAVSSPGIVLIDCWAPWCRACNDFQPIFEDAATRHTGCLFTKVNTQQEEQLVSDLGIEHIPSLVLYRDGLMLFNQAGYIDSSGLEDIISQAESLDMNEVRSAIEADEKEQEDPSCEAISP